LKPVPVKTEVGETEISRPDVFNQVFNQYMKEVETMELYEAIQKRRTIRKFKGPATEEQLKRIITQGTKAPSPRNRQSWEFVVVDNPSLIKKISEIKYVINRGKPLGEEVVPEQEKSAQTQKDSFNRASLVLVYHQEGETDAAGAWCCIQNMLLAAAAEGLGSRIARFWGEAVEEIADLLHVPEGMTLAAAISIGVPDETPGAKEFRSEGSWLHRNRF
jgi:nitroreductase